jgi:UDP-2,3-diacylglucosamine pyrophosphatase LpxH
MANQYSKGVTDQLLQDTVNMLAQCEGNLSAAARKLNIPRATFKGRLEFASRRGITSSTQAIEALHGWSPDHDMTHTVPSPMVLRGTSTLYDEDGKVRLQWVKTKLDDLRAEAAIRAYVTAMTAEIEGLSPLVDAPEHVMDDLLAVYPIGDPHIGMYAWQQEAGDDFDLDIARHLTFGAVDRLVSSMPPASTAIVLPLGDVFHSDNQTNQTPGHKHQLDVDSRYVKVLGVGIEVFRHVVLRVLENHRHVIVRFVTGNHDPHSIWALAMTIAGYFSNEPRVMVDLSPSRFWFYRFGQVLIGATHGDTAKHDVLPGVMAADKPQDWGTTVHRYWYTGHVHHQSVREYPGVVCESFRTLAAKDAYAAGAGYRAGRDMLGIVHHTQHGEIERHRCDVGLIHT